MIGRWRWRRPALQAIGCSVLSLIGVAGLWAQDGPRRFEIGLVGPSGGPGKALREAVSADLARTPRRHDLLTFAAQDFAPGAGVERLLAVVEVEVESTIPGPRIELARAGDTLSPGWLVHAILRAGSTVGVEVDFVDSRSSWLGQLVHRSIRRRPMGAADSALTLGVPAVRLVVPATDDTAAKLLAATVRRLDGLDGYPLFEDEFLVVGRRVMLRRDLYWIGLVAWLALYWRGRKHPVRKQAGRRQFRWLLLVAWLLAPIYASLLLILPVLVASLKPTARWLAAAALLPAAYFALLLAIAVSGPEALVLSGLPALTVVFALAAWVWQYLVRPSQLGEVEAQ